MQSEKAMPRRDNYCNPCRICGNTKISEYITPSGSYMSCDVCKVSTDIGTSSMEASLYWNAVMRKDGGMNEREV